MVAAHDLLELAKKRLYANYKPASFVLDRGKGCEVWDTDGKRYLDLCAGVAVCSVGHAHPSYVKALAEQAGTLGHVSNWFYNRVNIECAEKLCAVSGMDRAFFCNSGTEAAEAVLKLTRHHFYGKGDTKRVRILAFNNAFHGRTMGALSLTGTPKYREGFGDFDHTNVTHLPYGDLDAVKKAMGPDVAAIMLEPIQGEGGVLPAPAGFLQALRALCTENGALLIIDEVQTGVGRMGTWFAYQKADVKPDAVAMAKGLGGGFPVGAMLTTEALAGALPPGTHGTTYGGNPLGCAAILSVISIIEQEGLLENAAARGAQLHAGLLQIAKDFPKVCETARGDGLLQGLVMNPGFAARDVAVKAFAMGYLIIGAGDRVLRYAPPLIISEAQVSEALDATRRLIKELAG
jgi:acetylornithine/N-succinyldiaminopimelate aminotransferase